MNELVVTALLSVLCALVLINTVISAAASRSRGMRVIEAALADLKERVSRVEIAALDEYARGREEAAKSARENREELSRAYSGLSGAVSAQISEMRREADRRLTEMRKVVDDNLKDTVEKRFNESFKLISDRLERVHQGLGEMASLAGSVGDLKKVLSNVKTRGTMGEIQLEAILEQTMAPSQYASQVRVRDASAERVDFAVLLPDKNSEEGMLLLPIDSKFPIEDYQRLTDAYETDTDTLKQSAAFEAAVRKCARSINEKYINPPVTTDFAILFVPTEGLYSEITRRPGLFEQLARDYKVTVVGPTTVAAFLHSLQMGFRTLAIERSSNEVWRLLGAAKAEFSKFGDSLEKVRRRLDMAVKEVDGVGVRTRAVERALRGVSEAPAEISEDETSAGAEDDL
jgi:DNA recombination protein RmuC